jgi:hypothetical protein
MLTRETRGFGKKPDQVVAAIFFNDVSTRDAIADLKLAGFHADEIGVALSERRDAKHLPPEIEGKHSILWQLRHAIRHDNQSHGAGLSNAEDLAAACKERPAFTTIDLAETLGRRGVAKETIKLLDDRMGPDGSFIIVDAGDRGEKEVESILVRNRGMLRTVMATEPTDSMPIERV